ncbi:hypothetical protein HOLleu_02719 [Holothuria leucospilota]|uniref:Peptidase S8/S53 domain-containing protein n=1 Tax=Holothuria leucospilota TaxID=206669 RepID=A0A9Q1CS09_HOLLE|nr:hypothetical protein HOLleu_02719 [Holothuria leucospilota]
MNVVFFFVVNGEGVSVYVIDTGVNPTHIDLAGRCDPFYDAYPVGLTEYGVDCNGHGSHCAGTVAGTTYGVAKKAHIYGVRVLSCIGFGSTEGVVSGCEKVASDAILPAVASLSLGGGASEAMDAGIVAMVRNGVTSVVAAGNSNEDACLSSPAREETAITVSASDINDQRAFFSNYGSCSDIYAPGVLITSIWFNTDNSTNTISGTSMACPHVAGAAALILEENPDFSPSVVKAALVNTAVSDKIEDAGPDTPNKLLQVKRV